jgi:hypothetical protein
MISCNNSEKETKQMQTEIDSLKTALNNTYRPGFGEFMSGIQTHHAKLWFAGTNGNWPLADFEINEVREALDDIQMYCNDRPESKEIKMIYPAIDSVNLAVKMKNVSRFQNSFRQMTNICNECHSITSHAFNVITVPDKLPVVNQDFKVH